MTAQVWRSRSNWRFEGGLTAGPKPVGFGRYVLSHSRTQRKHSALGRTNAMRQPYRVTSQTTSGGAMTEPTMVPPLKIPTPSARSLGGNHSPTTLVEPEKLPHSPVPSQKRRKLNCNTEFASPCIALARDHQTMAKVKPRRAPQRSISMPIGNSPSIMPSWKKATIIPYCVLDMPNSLVSTGAIIDKVCRSTKLMTVARNSSARMRQRMFSGFNPPRNAADRIPALAWLTSLHRAGSFPSVQVGMRWLTTDLD